MFDRGLIGFDDDLGILVSRQVNDRSSIDAMINKTGRALADSFVGASSAGARHPARLATAP